MNITLLSLAFASISLNLDPSSINIIGSVMDENGMNLTKFDETYYVKKDNVLVEFNEIRNIMENGNPSSQIRIDLYSIAQFSSALLNIQDRVFDDPNNSDGRYGNIYISSHVYNGLSIRYLFERIDELENKINSVGQ